MMIMYIINNFILKKQYYHLLKRFPDSIDKFILYFLGKENNLGKDVLEYLFNTNPYLRNEITELYSLTVSQQLLNKLPNIKKLNIKGNYKITDLNSFKKLEELNISGHTSGVNQKGISKLNNIKVLYVGDNDKIHDLNHMPSLEILDAGDRYCVLKQEGISNLRNVKVLNIRYNSNMYDVKQLHLLIKYIR